MFITVEKENQKFRYHLHIENNEIIGINRIDAIDHHYAYKADTCWVIALNGENIVGNRVDADLNEILDALTNCDLSTESRKMYKK
jgi:hypothetical protein